MNKLPLKLVLKAAVSLSVAVALAPWTVLAQSVDEDERDQQTVLDSDPVLSTRGAGMGHALAPHADGNDAAFYNPAGIGGLHLGKEPKHRVRQFYFLYGGAAINENSQELNQEMRTKGAANDAAIGQAVIDANAGKRQYARVSLFPNLGYSRFMIGPIIDSQMAAVPIGDNTDLVDVHYRERTGIGMGFSVTDPKERLYLGVFATHLSIKDVRGEFLYTDMIDKTARQEAIKDETNKYSGIATNVGMLWRIAKEGAPTLAIVARDVGGTSYQKTSGDAEGGLDIPQDLTFGLGLSPALGKIGYFNFSVEGAHLTAKETAVEKKWRSGMEFNFGDRGIKSFFGLRCGGSDAGASFGTHLNLGILGAQYANFAEDIGVDNKRMIERRQAFIVSVNLAE